MKNLSCTVAVCPYDETMICTACPAFSFNLSQSNLKTNGKLKKSLPKKVTPQLDLFGGAS